MKAGYLEERLGKVWFNPTITNKDGRVELLGVGSSECKKHALKVAKREILKRKAIELCSEMAVFVSCKRQPHPNPDEYAVCIMIDDVSAYQYYIEGKKWDDMEGMNNCDIFKTLNNPYIFHTYEDAYLKGIEGVEHFLFKNE